MLYAVAGQLKTSCIDVCMLFSMKMAQGLVRLFVVKEKSCEAIASQLFCAVFQGALGTFKFPVFSENDDLAQPAAGISAQLLKFLRQLRRRERLQKGFDLGKLQEFFRESEIIFFLSDWNKIQPHRARR